VLTELAGIDPNQRPITMSKETQPQRHRLCLFLVWVRTSMVRAG
jgi:hypothetical protein